MFSCRPSFPNCVNAHCRAFTTTLILLRTATSFSTTKIAYHKTSNLCVSAGSLFDGSVFTLQECSSSGGRWYQDFLYENGLLHVCDDDGTCVNKCLSPVEFGYSVHDNSGEGVSLVVRDCDEERNRMKFLLRPVTEMSNGEVGVEIKNSDANFAVAIESQTNTASWGGRAGERVVLKPGTLNDANWNANYESAGDFLTTSKKVYEVGEKDDKYVTVCYIFRSAPTCRDCFNISVFDRESGDNENTNIFDNYGNYSVVDLIPEISKTAPSCSKFCYYEVVYFSNIPPGNYTVAIVPQDGTEQFPLLKTNFRVAEPEEEVKTDDANENDETADESLEECDIDLGSIFRDPAASATSFVLPLVLVVLPWYRFLFGEKSSCSNLFHALGTYMKLFGAVATIAAWYAECGGARFGPRTEGLVASVFSGLVLHVLLDFRARATIDEAWSESIESARWSYAVDNPSTIVDGITIPIFFFYGSVAAGIQYDAVLKSKDAPGSMSKALVAMVCIHIIVSFFTMLAGMSSLCFGDRADGTFVRVNRWSYKFQDMIVVRLFGTLSSYYLGAGDFVLWLLGDFGIVVEIIASFTSFSLK